VNGRQADLTHVHCRGGRSGERHLCPHVLYAPARPCGLHLLSHRRAGRRSVWMVRSGRKGAAQHAAYCRRVSVCEPYCMRVPSQGPHGGGAVRCYTGNGPMMRHAFCTRARCGIRELRAGVDPIKILKILKMLLLTTINHPATSRCRSFAIFRSLYASMFELE
jgi:hypothetical protein